MTEPKPIPIEDWIIEKPFDSADWMDLPPIIYESAPDARTAKGEEAADNPEAVEDTTPPTPNN